MSGSRACHHRFQTAMALRPIFLRRRMLAITIGVSSYGGLAATPWRARYGAGVVIAQLTTNK
ncbi:MAG: hypothetical protein KJ622_03625 [Alphaproteobacteria bacterium]|nr:hypothetical protein [Alphaproteobacteria bacterium]